MTNAPITVTPKTAEAARLCQEARLAARDREQAAAVRAMFAEWTQIVWPVGAAHSALLDKCRARVAEAERKYG